MGSPNPGSVPMMQVPAQVRQQLLSDYNPKYGNSLFSLKYLLHISIYDAYLNILILIEWFLVRCVLRMEVIVEMEWEAEEEIFKIGLLLNNQQRIKVGMPMLLMTSDTIWYSFMDFSFLVFTLNIELNLRWEN